MTYILDMSKKESKTSSLSFRMTDDDKKKIEDNAAKLGFYNVSDYVRMVAINANIDVNI